MVFELRRQKTMVFEQEARSQPTRMTTPALALPLVMQKKGLLKSTQCLRKPSRKFQKVRYRSLVFGS